MATILVVDDHSVSRECTATLLRGSGYDVLRAANGADALDLLSNCQADLALVDVLMPGMDGFELLQTLRSQPATDSLPVILVTGSVDPDVRQRGSDLGATDCLIKSRFSPDDLLTRIARHLPTTVAA